MPKIKAEKPAAADTANGSKSMEVNFDFERETKGAVLFREREEGEEKRIGTLYIRKMAFGTSFPKSIAVTVTY